MLMGRHDRSDANYHPHRGILSLINIMTDRPYSYYNISLRWITDTYDNITKAPKHDICQELLWCNFGISWVAQLIVGSSIQQAKADW